MHPLEMLKQVTKRNLPATHKKIPEALAIEGTIQTTTPEKIRALDLEPIKFKLIKEKGWSLQRADTVEQLYKAYLTLFALYPKEEHVPTADIDEMWHSHILDTHKYMADCQDIFGFYLHHYPYLGMLGTEDAAMATAQFEATRRRFMEVAGLDPVEAANCGGGGGCGGGGSSCGGGGSSCGGGGHSCSGGSSHSCSGGSHDSGGGHGGHDSGGGHHTPTHTPTPDIAPPIISSCTSSIPSEPLTEKWKKKKDKPVSDKPANDQGTPQKKKPFWKRIIGALGGTIGRKQPETTVKAPPSKWEMSVNPKYMRTKGRPTRADLVAMLSTLPENATKH